MRSYRCSGVSMRDVSVASPTGWSVVAGVRRPKSPCRQPKPYGSIIWRYKGWEAQIVSGSWVFRFQTKIERRENPEALRGGQKASHRRPCERWCEGCVSPRQSLGYFGLNRNRKREKEVAGGCQKWFTGLASPERTVVATPDRGEKWLATLRFSRWRLKKWWAGHGPYLVTSSGFWFWTVG